MQLININAAKLIPLSISGSILASAFSYNVLDRSTINSIMSSPNTNNYILQANEDIYSHLSLKSQFIYRVTAWKLNTKYLSFADQIVADVNFQAIVSMGINAVPFILEEINRDPSPLVWSLNIIFDKTISNKPETTIEEACKLWVKSMS